MNTMSLLPQHTQVFFHYSLNRICHCEAEFEAPLVAPCCCAGSLKYVHQGCLQRWVQSSDMKNCELCKYPFIMQTKIKPFKEVLATIYACGFAPFIQLSVTLKRSGKSLTCLQWSVANWLVRWRFTLSHLPALYGRFTSWLIGRLKSIIRVNCSGLFGLSWLSLRLDLPVRIFYFLRYPLSFLTGLW